MDNNDYGLLYFDNLGKYLRYKKDFKMSEAHVYMVWYCVNYLKNSKAFKNSLGSYISISTHPVLNKDKIYSDIYTNFFNIECETGLKHSYKSLQYRILHSKKTIIVVVPNKHILLRYIKNCRVRKQKLFFCTLKELPIIVNRSLRPIQNKLKTYENP